MANCRDRPSHDEGPDTRDAREYRPRPAIHRGRQGHGRARPRAREARDALSLPQLTAGPRGDPLAGKTREGPDHAGFPGGRRPRGNLTRVVSSDMSARPPRKGETPPAVRPGPPRARVRARVRLPAGPGRGPPLGGGPPNASRHPGLERGRARGVLRHLGRRAPSWSSTGRAGACRTQARRPKDPSWTPSSRMGQTRQAICWTLC